MGQLQSTYLVLQDDPEEDIDDDASYKFPKPEKVEEELLGDLSQEEDDDDLSSQCKHCGVDMFIESELKKHVLLRYIEHSNH